MKELCTKFLKILKVELEDLIEDIKLLEESYKEREQKGEITRYVLLENAGLLKHEIAGIEYLIECVERMSLDGCADISTVVAMIDEHLNKKNKESDFPDVVYSLVQKKLYKVHKYIEEV